MLARLDWKPAGTTIKTRLPKGRQSEIIRFATEFLREGFPTVFALEGACRTGLRSGLCLEGWNWQAADTAASQAVSLALSFLGAERPTWEQGQPEYTQYGVMALSRSRCVNCGGALSGDQAMYCSRNCAVSARNARADEDAKAIKRAKVYAFYAEWSAKQPEQPCIGCLDTFRPKRPGQRYCSKPCANRANAGDKNLKRRKHK